MSIVNQISRLFGYDAVENTNRRKMPAAHRRSEDRELTSTQRIVLSSATRDLQRNFSIAAWAIRKHLDYVSTFSFQANTGDDSLDEDLEELMRWYERPANFDAAGRLSRSRFVRMAEARRTLDGDVLVNFLASGQNQGIEAERVADPKDAAALALTDIAARRRYENGILIDAYGRALAYAVHRRTLAGTSLEFDRLLDAAFCYHHGYFDRYDQVRGISPLAPACNPLRDVYENFDYALAKAKVSQMFALAFYREKSDQLANLNATTDANGDGINDSDYQVSFGKGPIQLDLDPGDRAEFLESRQPSSEFQAFTNAMIGVSLKALDIPFSFFDEAHTNYSGQRQAWIQYDESAKLKRRDNVALLDWITARRLSLFVRDGDLTLPRGIGLGQVVSACTWISHGIPWIDPLKEITADVAAIKAGQIGPETACRQRGLDVYKMIDERSRVEAYARSRGVVLEYDLAALAAANAAAQPAQEKSDEEAT